jgi:3-(3-hydroxy-phenyl)propionate hydroxylase
VCQDSTLLWFLQSSRQEPRDYSSRTILILPEHIPTNSRYTSGNTLQASVVIVGAGPTGLAAGNLLGLAGVDTLILEQNATLSGCPKAISIDDEGLRICQAMGLGKEVMEHVLLGIDAHYLSEQRFLAKVSPTSKRNGYPLISTFNQPTFEATLLNGLERFACVKVLFQHTVETVEQDKQVVHLSVRRPNGALLQVECAFLLACDGGKSPIRHALGIPMLPPIPPLLWFSPQKNARRLEQDVGQRWLVVDCIEDEDDSAVATFFCDYRRPAVTVPAPRRARRWEFMLLPGDTEADLLGPDRIPMLIQQAQRSHPDTKAREGMPHVIRQTIYTFRTALAARFFQGRVFLLGDAAHLMPPFGGQGMNSGLRDAHNLYWKISLVLQRRAGPQLLETYHEERYPHVAQMILFSALLGRIIMPTNRFVALLRDLFFRGLNTLPPVREALTEMRVKPQPRYARGFLLPTSSKENKALRGVLLPQPSVQTQQGDLIFDDALGNGFALLRLIEEMTVSVQRPFELLNGHSHLLNHSDIVVKDSTQQISALFRSNRELCILVRPDRYVFGAFRAGETGRIVEDMQRMLQGG